jgi:hypothetical protein
MYKQPEADIGVLYFPNVFIIVMGNLIVPSCTRKRYRMELSDICRILFSLLFKKCRELCILLPLCIYNESQPTQHVLKCGIGNHIQQLLILLWQSLEDGSTANC